MLRYVIGIAVALATTPSWADNYYVMPTAQNVLERSKQECIKRGCDGVHTKYWWAVQNLTDGRATIIIQPNGPYGPDGLSDAEKMLLQTTNEMKTLLPWVLDGQTFLGRFTPQQLNKIQSSSNPVIQLSTQVMKSVPLTDLTAGTVTSMVSACVSEGILTSEEATNVLAWVPVPPIEAQ